ncbi:hypothetical protein [Marinobacter apostichopi]|uniref:hypothetical protein n=1 Tax=Marinobacter apostichopi TaxID=3035454 RepID=UPI002573F7AF|nr:hypothetical protein [Marinobacter sp. LA51]
MPLITPFQRGYLARWGPLRSAYAFAMDKLRDYLGFSLCVVVSRPAAGNTLPAIEKNYPAREYRLLDEHELLKHSADPTLELDADFIRERLVVGDTCSGALEGGVLLGYVWRAFSPVSVKDSLWVDAGSAGRYVYKAFTRPEYRGQNIVNSISVATESIYKGRTHNIAFIESHNYPSIRSAMKMGNKVIGYAGHWKIGSRYYCFRSPRARRLGFQFLSKV